MSFRVKALSDTIVEYSFDDDFSAHKRYRQFFDKGFTMTPVKHDKKLDVFTFTVDVADPEDTA